MSDAPDTTHTTEPRAEPVSAAPVPKAPFWRRFVARTIDMTIVLIVFALFLTPVIAAQRRSGSPLLRESAWVYLGIFVILAALLALPKLRHRADRHRYVTVGMSIMDIQLLRDGETTRMVRTRYLPEPAEERRGRAAVVAALPLILLGIVFLIFELITYA